MKLHYMGKFDSDPDSLPHGEHKPGAVPFKEPQSIKKFSIIANTVSFAALILLMIPVCVGIGKHFNFILFIAGCITPILTLFPHEFLHALCFKEDVYLYTNLKNGLAFVVGNETMSKARFILMSLLPNLVFGALPYVIGLIYPQLVFFGVFGAICIAMGAGDYFNVFNAIVQMPRGARTYLYKFNSFWYMPEKA